MATPRRATPGEETLGTAAPLVPERPDIENLWVAARACRACDLWRTGTQTVFGRGRAGAEVLFIGEQPGNDEDIAGEPFVGPAGRVLDRALAEAGIRREEAYVTNVVKHFKWIPQGKRRIHQKPNAREIRACRAWLDAEIAVVEPRIIVLLGATAAQAMLGPKFRVTHQRGRVIDGPDGRRYIATVHPSSILRAGDEEARRIETAMFIADLRAVVEFLDGDTARGRG